MKRATMELGGHAPAIVFKDADVTSAAKILSAAKYRNAGQVCISPTRMLVQDDVFREFVDKFVEGAKAMKVGNGMDPDSKMGSLANPRRVTAIEGMVQDAVEQGRQAGDRRPSHRQQGLFLRADRGQRRAEGCARDERGAVRPAGADLALLDASTRWPRRPTACPSVWPPTPSPVRPRPRPRSAPAIEAGMVSINSFGLALPEVPFGGIKDSGYGSEGGTEAMDGYFNTKFITQTGV